MSDKLIVISYNLHGFNQGAPGIREIISKLEPDLIMMQEHWLTVDNLNKIDTISSNYFVFSSSAMNAAVGIGPLYGRPFGGTAILINNKHVSSTMCISTQDRLTAIKLYNWLIITVYMPCVGTLQRDDLYNSLLIELQEIICDHIELKNCLIGGDFNLDLDNKSNLNLLVKEFMVYNCLYRCDVLYPVSNTATFFNESNISSSTIDYMLSTNKSKVIAFNVLDIDINLSDHSPIMAVCECDIPPSCYQVCNKPSNNSNAITHLRWDHAPVGLYYENTRLHLEPVLASLNLLLDETHDLYDSVTISFVDQVYDKVIDILRESANLFIPKHHKSYYKLEILKPNAITSCRVWRDWEAKAWCYICSVQARQITL
jgi:exonuclease III